MKTLSDLELPVTINTMPNEIENPIPFDQDEKHRSYDREYANRFWRALVQSDRVFKDFRSRFCGKCSPVHFFWGSFDLAVTRFSGRPAPPHPGGVPHLPDSGHARGLLSGSKQSRFLARQRRRADASLLFLCVSGTAWIRRGENSAGCGFLRRPNCANSSCLTNAVRTAETPDQVLLDFAQSAYDAASKLGKWDRVALEEKKPALHLPRQHS